MLGLLELLALPSMAAAQMQMKHGQGAPSGAATFKIGDLVVASPWTRACPST